MFSIDDNLDGTTVFLGRTGPRCYVNGKSAACGPDSSGSA